jgi:tRNA G10  N-methylase Trm11
VLETHGHRVVGTDLVAQGCGETGRDFLAETRLPDGVTAIVTNPPYGRRLYEFVDHALNLTQPVGGMVAMLVNIQWPTGAANSARCRMPAFDMEINSPLIKSNPSMIGTTFWATFPHSGLYAVCLKRSQEFINGLLGEKCHL